jgi:hypothetical protein
VRAIPDPDSAEWDDDTHGGLPETLEMESDELLAVLVTLDRVGNVASSKWQD